MSCEKTERGDETILTISGVLDAVTSPDIKTILARVVEERPPKVTVDLSALRLIDSSGVGAIVGLYKQVCAYQGSLSVIGVKNQPAAIFRLLRLDRVFPI